MQDFVSPSPSRSALTEHGVRQSMQLLSRELQDAQDDTAAMQVQLAAVNAELEDTRGERDRAMKVRLLLSMQRQCHW